MTIQQIYELAIKMGMDADPRGKTEVRRLLQKAKKDCKDLPEKKRKFFDKESFTNPYSDTRIFWGDPKLKVKKVLAGIDAGEAEVLLTDRLNQKGEGIDLLISHHPVAHALTALDEVMDLQVDIFAKAGVPENVAHALFETRKEAVHRQIGPLNHSRSVDAARLLNVPFMSIHTVWDNLGHNFMVNYLKDKKYTTVGDLVDIINEVPEFAESSKGKAAPSIVSGAATRRTGKVMVGFTGGTNPSKELYIELAKAGVGTIIEMHIQEEVIEELRKLHINIIDTSHMASDSIGANLFLDELEHLGVEAVACSGLIRVKRSRKNK